MIMGPKFNGAIFVGGQGNLQIKYSRSSHIEFRRLMQ